MSSGTQHITAICVFLYFKQLADTMKVVTGLCEERGINQKITMSKTEKQWPEKSRCLPIYL